MKTTVCLSLLVLLVASSLAKKWGGLGVTWNANLFKYPTNIPRTQDEAWFRGWKQIGSNSCDGDNYKGTAWVNPKSDYSTAILLDVNGYIAGIQAGISKKEHKASNFPPQGQMPPFVKTGEFNTRYVISAYFIDPSKICTTGRTKEEFDRDGTGTALYIQNGDELVEIPKRQKDIQSPWTEGQCFITMGKHYWYNLSYDMDCDSAFPVFLLYNGGDLNGFGWAFTGGLESENYEHPESSQFSLFIKDVPRCFNEIPKISTMHVYLDGNAALNFC